MNGNNLLQAVGLTPRPSTTRNQGQRTQNGIMESVTVQNPNDINGGGLKITQIFPTPSAQSNNFIFQQPGQYCISLHNENYLQSYGRLVGNAVTNGTSMPLAAYTDMIPKEQSANVHPSVTERSVGLSGFRSNSGGTSAGANGSPTI